MPPKGWRKPQPEPGASPNETPNDTRPNWTAGAWAAAEPVIAADLRRIAAEAALVAAAKRLAARSPDIVQPEFRGPYTKDRNALLAALAEYQSL